MLGRKHHEGPAVDRVGPCREDADWMTERRHGKIDVGADRAADPVALHQFHFFRPVLERIESGVEPIGVGRDLEEPLLELALHDHRSAAFAPAVDHLFVREHGLIARTPVDGRLPAIRQAALVELNEEPLVPLVITGMARGDLFRPVVEDPPSLELLFLACDVREGPFARMRAAFDGGVFGGQAECIPAHRIECRVPAHPQISIEGVAQDVVASVTDVEIAGRIRKHVQHVVLVARLGDVDLGHTRVGPRALPLFFELFGVVRHKGHEV